MTPEPLPTRAFQGRRLLREGTWVVAFLAEWCPFCHAFLPSFETLDGEGAFRTAVADLTDDESPLWDDFGIEVVPALIVFSEGRPIFREQSDRGVGLRDGALGRARAAALSGRE